LPDVQRNPLCYMILLTSSRVRQERGLMQRCERIEARPATEDELTSVHNADYVQQICSLRDQASRAVIAGGKLRGGAGCVCWMLYTSESKGRGEGAPHLFPRIQRQRGG
jgi:acetoin utilization deacetylase AcuC-like enzyme